MQDLRQTLSEHKHDNTTFRMTAANNTPTKLELKPTTTLPLNTPLRDITRTIENNAAKRATKTLLEIPKNPHDKPAPLTQPYQLQPVPGHTPTRATYQPTPRQNLPAGQYFTPPRARQDTNTTMLNQRQDTTRYNRQPPFMSTPPTRTHSRTPVFNPKPIPSAQNPSTNTAEMEGLVDQKFEHFKQEIRSTLSTMMPSTGSHMGPTNPNQQGH